MSNYYTDIIDRAIKNSDPNYPVSIRINGGNYINCPPELLTIIRNYYATHTPGELCQPTLQN